MIAKHHYIQLKIQPFLRTYKSHPWFSPDLSGGRQSIDTAILYNDIMHAAQYCGTHQSKLV